MSYHVLAAGMPLSIDFPQAHEKSAQVIDGFRTFLKEVPFEERNIFTFINDDLTGGLPAVDHENAELGYFCRTGKRHNDPKYDAVGGVYDRKDVWHFVPRLWQYLEIRRAPLSSTTHNWLLACEELFHECKDRLYDFADQEQLRKSRLLQSLCAGERGRLGHTHALRLINYHRQSAHEPMGHGHTDRDTLTLHVAESWPAMHCSKTRRLCPAQPNRALLFPGDKAQTLLGTPAFNHYVHDESGRSMKESRWAVVFFAHAQPLP